MKVTEYDNRAFGGSVGFYTKRGKVILNFKRKVISVYRRNRKKGWYFNGEGWYFNGEWSLVKEWQLKS